MKLNFNDLERFFKKSFSPAAVGSSKKTSRTHTVTNALRMEGKSNE
jgi:hypothetical protein